MFSRLSRQGSRARWPIGREPFAGMLIRKYGEELTHSGVQFLETSMPRRLGDRCAAGLPRRPLVVN
jgi:hypothetical protein